MVPNSRARLEPAYERAIFAELEQILADIPHEDPARRSGHLAAFMSGLLAARPRPITWFHLPVPIERDDDAYFAALAEVVVPSETELYVGLVHHEDGVSGAERRLAAARRAQPCFGVATECGFGRGPSERTAALLDLHAAVSRPW